jgi:hypothetical protein
LMLFTHWAGVLDMERLEDGVGNGSVFCLQLGFSITRPLELSPLPLHPVQELICNALHFVDAKEVPPWIGEQLAKAVIPLARQKLGIEGPNSETDGRVILGLPVQKAPAFPAEAPLEAGRGLEVAKCRGWLEVPNTGNGDFVRVQK